MSFTILKQYVIPATVLSVIGVGSYYFYRKWIKQTDQKTEESSLVMTDCVEPSTSESLSKEEEVINNVYNFIKNQLEGEVTISKLGSHGQAVQVDSFMGKVIILDEHLILFDIKMPYPDTEEFPTISDDAMNRMVDQYTTTKDIKMTEENMALIPFHHNVHQSHQLTNEAVPGKIKAYNMMGEDKAMMMLMITKNISESFEQSLLQNDLRFIQECDQQLTFAERNDFHNNDRLMAIVKEKVDVLNAIVRNKSQGKNILWYAGMGGNFPLYYYD